MKNSLIVSIAVAGMFLLNLNVMAQSGNGSQNQVVTGSKTLSSSNMDFKTDMRVLWGNQSMLTHNVILCIVDGQPGIDEAKNMLVKNQEAIGNSFAIYYGEEAGKKLTKLLYRNATIAADIMIATRNENYGVYVKAYKTWKDNTGQILAFLNQTNPNWNLNNLKTMMYDQIQFTTNEATDIKNKNFDGSTKAYNNAIKAETVMADIFSDGIISQFPAKFSELALAVNQK